MIRITESITQTFKAIRAVLIDDLDIAFISSFLTGTQT